jgi:hypothetical protein
LSRLADLQQTRAKYVKPPRDLDGRIDRLRREAQEMREKGALTRSAKRLAVEIGFWADRRGQHPHGDTGVVCRPCQSGCVAGFAFVAPELAQTARQVAHTDSGGLTDNRTALETEQIGKAFLLIRRCIRLGIIHSHIDDLFNSVVY